jgi:hypothetical protein
LKYSRWNIANFIYRELMYQSYAASQLTGLSAGNVKRALNNSIRQKYMISVIYGFIIVIFISTGSLLGAKYASVLPLELFLWSFFIIFASSMQLSFSVSSSSRLKDLLSTLPIDSANVKAISELSIIRAVDMPILVPLAISIVLGAMAGIDRLLAYMIADVTAIALSLLVINLMILAFRQIKLGSRTNTLARLAVSLPIIALAMTGGLIQQFYALTLNPLYSYLPIVDLPGILQGETASIYTSVLYMIVFALAAYFFFRRAAIELLSPAQMTTSISNRKLFVKRSSPTMAVISTDFKQMIRSRMSGLFIMPFMYFFIVLISALISGTNLLKTDYLLFWGSYMVPLAFISSIIGFMLYMSEMRGQATYRLLPLSRNMNLLAKELVTIGDYLIGAVLMSALVIFLGGRFLYVLPIWTLTFTIMPLVAFAGFYFEYSYKKGGAGIASLTSIILYTVTTGALFGLPVVLFIVGYLMHASLIVGSISMVLASLLELSAILYFTRTVIAGRSRR